MESKNLGLIAGPVDMGPELSRQIEALRNAGASLVWGRKVEISELIQAGQRAKIPVGAEIQDVRQVKDFLGLDLILVPAERMQDRVLLEELGKCSVPVLLRRGKGSTLEELLKAAQVLKKPILCESGIRWREEILDLSAIAALHHLSPFPVGAEPGKWGEALTQGAVAAGADFLILPPEAFPETARKLRRLRKVLE